jgi:hypothetical protein
LSLKCDFLVSKFTFKWVNLYRYEAALVGMDAEAELRWLKVGLYKLNAAAP